MYIFLVRIINIDIYIMILCVVLSNSWLVRLITSSLTAIGGGGEGGRGEEFECDAAL